MFLIFNKEFRQFESILSDLRKKIEKSQTINVVYDGFDEIYKLDTIDIIFALQGTKNQIIVKDKSGKKIIALDCHYDNNDELQMAKSNQFSAFLSAVRNYVDERKKRANKRASKFATATKQAENALKIKQEKARKDQMMADALERLHSL